MARRSNSQGDELLAPIPNCSKFAGSVSKRPAEIPIEA